eukprot:6213109-Pleurochrysis_carterae.AAC.6
MHSFAICICIACVLAERSRSAPQALDSPLCAFRPTPASTPTQSRPVGALSPRAVPAPGPLVVGIIYQ